MFAGGIDLSFQPGSNKNASNFAWWAVNVLLSKMVSLQASDLKNSMLLTSFIWETTLVKVHLCPHTYCLHIRKTHAF